MPWFRALLSLTLLAALARPAAAHEAAAPETNWVPEPMLFDLVRGLAARKGEAEVGFGTNLRGSEVEIGPEIELVVADGHALEFEITSPHTERRGVRGVYQATMGRGLGGNLLHGPHFTGAYSPGEELAESTAVYVACLRLDPTWSVIAMGGAEAERRGTSARLNPIANASVFADLHDSLILGLEGTWSQSAPARSRVDVLPQLRWDLNEAFHVQVGYGATLEDGQTRPLGSLRVSQAF